MDDNTHHYRRRAVEQAILDSVEADSEAKRRALERENARNLAMIADALAYIIENGLSVSATTTTYRADRL